MTTKSLISRIGGMIRSSQMFERPSKKIIGSWQLFEYFMDKHQQLVHLQIDDLKAKQEYYQIDFQENEFQQNLTLEVECIQNLPSGKWEINKNFLQLIDESNFRNNVEFQFAFEKENLKLLKKNKQGEIEFFGFFSRVPD